MDATAIAIIGGRKMKYEEVKYLLEKCNFIILREEEKKSYWLSESGRMMRLTDKGERDTFLGKLKYDVELCQVSCVTF